jgi:hypothetical protein
MIKKLFLCVVVLALFSSLFLIQSASAKLVAAWLFDENSGVIAKDSVSGIVGNIKGGVTWDTGKFKSALKFDGKSGQVDIPDPKNVLAPKNITIAAWVKLNDVTGIKSIAEQYDWAGAFGTHAFRMNGAEVQLWLIWGAGGDNATGGAVKAGEWTHIAGSYNGETARTYINGKMVAEKKLAKKDLVASSKSLSIGVRGDSKDVQWMAGSIDEVAIYDSALSEADLTKTMGGLGVTMTAVSLQDKMPTVWAGLKESHK